MRRESTQPSFESLEMRRHLSGSPLADLYGQELHADTNLHIVQPLKRPSPPPPTSPPPTTLPPGYSPAQIRHAYGFDQILFNGSVKGDGSGQTIAIVDAYDDPNIASDLNVFNTTYGLPAMDGKNGNGLFTKVLAGSIVPGNSGWGLEISLDVEWAHAMAPKANIVLVEASSASLNNLFTAVDMARSRAGVSVVSMSWGAGEFSSESLYDFHFTTPNGHAPVTFVASSGDSGAPLEWPSASPNVLSVGGTSLTLDSSGNYSSEAGWAGSTGGISAYELRPSYQANVAIDSTMRLGPDVSYVADPYTGMAVYDSYGQPSKWQVVGGTSAGAPQWAALVAIADQGRTLAVKATLSTTQVLTALYSMPSASFFDVTSGSSTGSPGYTAGSGYDLVTGLGSPHADGVTAQLLALT